MVPWASSIRVESIAKEMDVFPALRIVEIKLRRHTSDRMFCYQNMHVHILSYLHVLFISVDLEVALQVSPISLSVTVPPSISLGDSFLVEQ